MRANTLMVCVLAAACAVAAEYPEKAEDSQAIRSQQYRQMDAYLDKQVEQAEARRTGYWSKLDFASPAAYDRSAQVYRDDWSRYLGVPERAAAPWTHRRVKLAEFDDCTAYRVWIETVPGVDEVTTGTSSSAETTVVWPEESVILALRTTWSPMCS